MTTDTDSNFDQQRRNFDLLLRAQRLGRTGYIISDIAAGRVYWSDSLFEQRKVPRRPFFTRQEGLEFIHPDDRAPWEALRASAIADRQEFQHECRIVCGDGTIIWERGSSQPQYDVGGNFTGLLSVVDDITEEKLAVTSLIEQEATYRALFDSIGDAIFLTQNGVFIDCNDAALRMFGATRAQMVGETPVRYSPEFQPDGRPSQEKAAEKIAGALAGQRQTFEWHHKRYDGSEFDAEVVLSRVDGTGEPMFFGVVRDITERKQADAALKASHDKFAGAFSASTDAMVVMRMGEQAGEGVFVDANAAAAEMFGLEWREMVGKTVRETNLLISPSRLPAFRTEVLKHGRISAFRATVQHKDGSPREVEISASLFGPRDDRMAILVVRDVTEQEAAARKIGELNATLEANLRQLRAITDNLPVGVSQTSLDGRILFLNKTLERWLAIDTQSARGRPAAELFSKDYIDATKPMRDAFAAGARTVEQTLRLPDGTVRTIEATNIPDLDAAGVQHSNFGFVVDVSERKRAEAELHASHEKFASAFEYSTDAVLVSTIGETLGGGMVIEMNRSAEQVFGRPRDNLIGRKFSDLLRNATMFPLGETRRRITSDGSFRDLPAEIKQPDGSVRHFLISGARFNLGDQAHSLTVLRDVTEAREAENKIRELNASLEASVGQLRAITNNIPVAISFQDAHGRFQFVNHTMEQWFAASGEQMVGKTIHPLVSDAYLKVIEPIRARRKAGILKSEVTLPYPDGKTRTVELTFVPERDGSSAEPVGYYTLAVDMTERKAAEEQMQQSQKLQAIGKLTGGVAHDFNNLLAVIAGNLDLAAERGGDERIMRLLEPARRAAERGSTLTRSLLAFARQQPLSPQVADLNSLARDMTELLRRTLPSNIGTEFVGGAGLWKCEVDPGQLQNALLNLVVNARDAMPDGGRLTIETQNARIDADYAATHELLAGQYVMLAVSDTGTGMPAEVVARAFEPFYTTKGVGEGTGLGLSMVYGFAKQSGGHVAIYSEVGSGTSVKVYLPRWKGAEADIGQRADTAVSVANSETVLVVEDDADMRLVAVTMLRSLGYTVLEAPTGTKGLDLLAQHPEIALLVSDVVLAGSMNGRRLAQEALAANPHLKVLFMSGYTEDAIVHHGRLEHGVHFIQKPFRKQDLAAKAREALDG